ncbi:MAG: hypothetical protein WAO98_08925 [Alphaproteobacteria bacterium]
MNAHISEQRVIDIQRRWNSLELKTTNAIPLDDATISAILMGTNDPVRLLSYKPAVQSLLMELAGSNKASPEEAEMFPYWGDQLREYKKVCTDIRKDFSRAARVVIQNVATVETYINAAYFDAPLTPFLHSDGRVINTNAVTTAWILVSRTGALPVLAAYQADLERANPTQVQDAQLVPGRINSSAISATYKSELHTKQQKAFLSLADQEILKPLNLGDVYLMRTRDRTEPDMGRSIGGCQHASNPHVPAKSCFTKSSINVYKAGN